MSAQKTLCITRPTSNPHTSVKENRDALFSLVLYCMAPFGKQKQGFARLSEISEKETSVHPTEGSHSFSLTSQSRVGMAVNDRP